MIDAATHQRREAIVRRHPRYELVATGRPFRVRMTAFFIFDARTLQRQLLEGAGPLTWLRTLPALGRSRGVIRSPEPAP